MFNQTKTLSHSDDLRRDKPSMFAQTLRRQIDRPTNISATRSRRLGRWQGRMRGGVVSHLAKNALFFNRVFNHYGNQGISLAVEDGHGSVNAVRAKDTDAQR